MSKPYSIGEFSRLSGLTVKALRFYEASGLLFPAFVDPGNSYRFYQEAQLETAATIASLRATGMPLEAVAATLASDSPDGVRKQLVEQRQRLLLQLEETNRRVAVVDTLLASHAKAPGLRVVAVEPLTVLSESVRVNSKGAVSQAFERLELCAAEAQCRAPAAPFCELNPDQSWRVCVPVHDNAAVNDPVEFWSRGGLACSLSYAGPYRKTSEYLESLADAISRSGLQALGPAREIYHRFGAQQEGYELPRHVLANKDADYVTELQISIHPPEAMQP